jgi:glucosamine kinase
VAGPANIRSGLKQSFAAVFEATAKCLAQAGLSPHDLPRITACLAMAGASEPTERDAAERYEHPFNRMVVTADAHAACIGAHQGRDGGVIIVGTGTIGWAEHNGRHYRVGGWGLPVSDEGSGAWLGCKALQQTLWAYDGRRAWTPLLSELFERFSGDPHAVVRWTSHASPRDFGSFAPAVIEHAETGDDAGVELMQSAARHIDELAACLASFGTDRLALAGGIAARLERWLDPKTRGLLTAPVGDALDGALALARAAARAPRSLHDISAAVMEHG